MSELEAKALRQPFRFGLMLGALALPIGWLLSEDVLRLVTSYPLLNAEEVTNYFASGALPGMVLGAGAVQAWAAWRANNLGEARWFLIGCGGLVALVRGAFLLKLAWHNSWWTGQVRLCGQPVLAWLALPFDPGFSKNFPLHCALAMFLLGLFLRSPRR